ncbi:c-type cytochrome [Aliiroseovarius lamellibrachiae]|uniref:c-type cytochrome n=1 Tax=Aliiroseovarius lamellibrachiae TaxID=1924933 RepID=UPI001BDFED71|nr:cytochrome c family protein [Aliiroseovarius lamellibrachiae]MBT2130262.1 cytochrome c family protein [Aliiroseovarius lamellibrachiae]
MFDTMTLTKAGGALCGALLIFLLGNWVAGSLYTSGGGHGGEDHAATGYVLAVADGAHAEEEVVEAVPFADLLAAADPAKGAKAWSKCKACHKLEEGANGTGPSLFGVVGRAVGAIDGFKYSDALTGLGGDWTPENLNHWLENPKAYAPGNKMTFKGLKKETDRANLIAYLQTIGG